MIRTNAAMKLLTTVLLTLATAFAQSSDRLPVTDAEKIADALRGGPAFITKDATVLDWPSAPGGEYRLLRKGSNEWTCLPAIPGYASAAMELNDRLATEISRSENLSFSGRTNSNNQGIVL